MAETRTFTADELKTYTEMVVQAEREACAKAAESSASDHADCGHEPLYWDGRHDAATCIRARAGINSGAPYGQIGELYSIDGVTLETVTRKLQDAGYQINPSKKMVGLFDVTRPDDETAELTLDQVFGLAHNL